MLWGEEMGPMRRFGTQSTNNGKGGFEKGSTIV